MSALPASQVSKLTGLSQRQLRYLTDTRVLVPSLRAKAGHGAEAIYTTDDLLALMVIAKVRLVCGPEIRAERVRTIVAAVGKASGSQDSFLVYDGSSAWVQGGTLEGTLSRQLGALVIDMGALYEELNLMLRREGYAALSYA